MPDAKRPEREDVGEHLARNLRELREAQGLTQLGLARRASVPRATLAHLETGAGNPTLSVLVKIASALGVTIEELVGPPRATGVKYRADQLPVRVKAGVEIKQIMPSPLPGIEIERLYLPPESSMRGTPHSAGTREYLFCERGMIELIASGNAFLLAAGEVVVFRGDQRHSYRNAGDTESVAFSVVLLAPPLG